ncbi:Indole-3-acetic acid-amido synthetase GH3.3 [Quillaja saponaria]|uniref:Indole-3-acetic acid-amido synthetase GH3.3 n=1 Tax=Quillaja saponaria TaxID=32244 RepID=A0AAD7VMD6_QUISA|nr:Indole-3-acetic acid-amido synthetase GH3.3 [Quillaja saponaria]
MPETFNVLSGEQEISFHGNQNMVACYNKKALNFIEEVTNNADEIQNRILSEILTRNSNVEYLQRHSLNGRTDKYIFKKMIPVVNYEDLKPDIDRIAQGDTSPILCYKPISEFFSKLLAFFYFFMCSSATSGGESKLIPMTDDAIETRVVLPKIMMSVMDQFIPGLDKGKAIYFSFVRPESKTPGGLVASPSTTGTLKFKKLNRHYDPYANYTNPIETTLCTDWYQSMYTQLLCGLCQNKQVLRMGSAFASGFVRAIKFLENHWFLLCKDIRTGKVDQKITDPSVREAVLKILKPNPDLADFIEAECGKESWKGIITTLWPNVKYINVVVTGTMSQYIPVLDYYTNGLPLVCTYYSTSECHIALNLNPLCKPRDVCYTIIPTLAYFEFLPVNRNGRGSTNSISEPMTSFTEDENHGLVDLVDVKMGEEYEVVVTTYSGLYRYCVGDILRVAGFKNKTPQFNYVGRKNVVLSIDADKTDEVELQNAVKNAVNNLLQFDATLAEYTSYADMSSIPGHYVLYWEIRLNRQTPIPPSVFENCCLVVEESLSSVYRYIRVIEKSIGPLEIKVVENGTFDKLMDYAVSNGASAGQYKTPRCVKLTPIIELLNSNVVCTYSSQECPKWIPAP